MAIAIVGSHHGRQSRCHEPEAAVHERDIFQCVYFFLLDLYPKLFIFIIHYLC